MTGSSPIGLDGAGSALDAVSRLLDLRPADGRLAAPSSTARRRWGVVAGRSGPRYLVPLDHPAATSASCLAYLGLRSPRARVARGVVGLALRARLDRLVVDHVLEGDAAPGSLIAHVEAVLAGHHGHEDQLDDPRLAIAIGLGVRDEVWKPTLQAFRPDGTPAAFAKVGLGPVAEALVRTEAEALARWSALPDPRLVVPDLLSDAPWNDVPLAIAAPLPVDVRRLPEPSSIAGPSAWAVRELDGPTGSATVSDAPWWRRRRGEAADDRRAVEVLERIEARHGDAPRSWARWHGDWVPWNLARCHRGLVAWDWEYSEPDAPIGLDEVHGAYQRAHVGARCAIADALEAAAAAADAIAPTLGAPDAPPASSAWLRDAHLAMLVGRAARIEQLTGRPVREAVELWTAAEHALGRSEARPR